MRADILDIRSGERAPDACEEARDALSRLGGNGHGRRVEVWLARGPSIACLVDCSRSRNDRVGWTMLRTEGACDAHAVPAPACLPACLRACVSVPVRAACPPAWVGARATCRDRSTSIDVLLCSMSQTGSSYGRPFLYRHRTVMCASKLHGATYCIAHHLHPGSVLAIGTATEAPISARNTAVRMMLCWVDRISKKV